MAGKLAPITFIVGAPRSGTTLLRVMLAGHPALWSPPEMILSPFSTMAEREAYLSKRYWEKGGLRRGLMDLLGISVEEAKDAVRDLGDKSVRDVYAYLQQLVGDRKIVDKSPQLTLEDATAIERVASWCTEPRFVWLVRHPGSVIRSVANMPMAEVMGAGMSGTVESYWRTSNQVCRDFLAGVPREHWTRIRYEDLVAEPEPAMRRVCEAIGVPFHPAVLEPYEGDRMREGPKGARAIGDSNMVTRGAIQPELATAWLANWDPSGIEDSTRELAETLGYEIDTTHRTPLQRLAAGLDTFWDAAREIERSIEIPMDIDAIEGRRFLLRMMSASIDTFVEQSDVDRPQFFHAEGPSRKMFADCPDTDYLRAPIRTDDGRVYRIWGNAPAGTLYVGVLLYGKGGRVGRRLRDEGLGVAPDGSFELRISTREQSGVWLQADGDETAVIVRQYFADRGAEAPIEVNIELERPEPDALAPLDPAVMTDQIHRATRMLRSIMLRTLGAYRMVTARGLNEFFEVGGEDLFPTPDNRYQVTWYRFAPGQLMLVRGTLPTARYFSLTLCNAWLESFDYRHHRCVLNHARLQTDDDGRFEVCLANEDPGHPNWMDTAGHNAGYIIARALLPEGPATELETQVMFVEEYERGA